MKDGESLKDDGEIRYLEKLSFFCTKQLEDSIKYGLENSHKSYQQHNSNKKLFDNRIRLTYNKIKTSFQCTA